jgi:hypothetical protein
MIFVLKFDWDYNDVALVQALNRSWMRKTSPQPNTQRSFLQPARILNFRIYYAKASSKKILIDWGLTAKVQCLVAVSSGDAADLPRCTMKPYGSAKE